MTACYMEIMSLGYKVTGAKHLGPLAWAFALVQQYSFVGDKLALYFGIVEEVIPDIVMQSTGSLTSTFRSTRNIIWRQHLACTSVA